MKKYVHVLFLFLVCLNGWAQTSKRREILRDYHIKKILSYHINSVGDPGYLHRISYINDSGLVVQDIWLNRKQDTSSINTYKYDEQNREIVFEILSDEKKIIYTSSYKKINESETEIIETCDGNTRVKVIREKTKGHKFKRFVYVDSRLVGNETTKGNKIIATYRGGPLAGTTTTTAYLDSKGNVTRLYSKTFRKATVRVIGGGTDPETGTLIERKKYKTKKSIGRTTVNYEYNDIGLITKKEFRNKDFKCDTFQYLTEAE